jgi:hypothetical protein
MENKKVSRGIRMHAKGTSEKCSAAANSVALNVTKCKLNYYSNLEERQQKQS